MMASRVLSRFLPVAEGDVSVYEGMRRNAAARADLEARGPASDERPFHDEDDDDPEGLLYDHADDESLPQNDGFESPEARPTSSLASPALERTQPKWVHGRSDTRAADDEDVPESLLLERKGKAAARGAPSQSPHDRRQARAEEQWRAAQEQHRLHPSQYPRENVQTWPKSRTTASVPSTAQPNPHTEAMWMFTNAHNLDAFLLEIYQYYVGHGVWSILLSRVLSMLTDLFLFSLVMFLTTCVDYSLIPASKSTSEVMIPKCMAKASWFKNAFMFCFIMYWFFMVARYTSGIRRLFRMHDFYLHVLGISDADIQTVSWVRVVDGLVKVQNANVATASQKPRMKQYLDYGKPQQVLTAEHVANRLMRQANYYVALYNKDILDFTLPIPFLGTRQFYSKSLEWSIDFCLTNFIFDEQGSIRPFNLDVRNRANQVKTLRARLLAAAAASVVLAPYNIIRFCVLYFFRYYTEFTRNPASASARSWTPYAEWKIREFNELDHLFQRRLRQAAPFANDYLKQFPKDKTDQACRFIAFVSGAFAAVLALATLFDPELFLGFEVTPGRTAVFWLTVMIGIFGVAHGALPDDNEVHDPVLHLKEVLMFTHYMPAHWKTRLHSNEVRAEFSSLYQMKILIFLEEILSLVLAPLILWRNSGKQAERLIDFFREQTVHVEGVGHQCNFAVFGFKKDLNAEDPTDVLAQPDGLRDDYYGLKDDKMAASVQNFMQYYSHHRQGIRRGQGWQPPPAWPPIMSPPAIAEGLEWQSPPDGRQNTSARLANLKRSGVLDRHQLPMAQRGGRPPGRASRMQKQQDLSYSRAGRSTGHGGVTESRLMAQDSDLQDYADADRLESDTDDGGEGMGIEERNNAGVLGMLYQFSKAQTEKGTGVHI